MTKKIYILLIFILGFTLMPTVTYACGSKTEKSCCNKDKTRNSDTKECCKKDKQHTNDNDNCDGECGDKSCHCPASHNSLTAYISQQSSTNIIDFSNENEKFHFIKTYFSVGFYSIWTPPNIG